MRWAIRADGTAPMGAAAVSLPSGHPCRGFRTTPTLPTDGSLDHEQHARVPTMRPRRLEEELWRLGQRVGTMGRG